MRIKFAIGDRWKDLCHVSTQQDANALVMDLTTKCDVRFKVVEY